MPTPVCFMVMPFGTKTTGAEPGKGPVSVDFDALWNKALKPAIEGLGYRPVRADQDTGALIIVEMLRRLAHADLVIADVSIPNANVYYEIGVRHAAQGRNCVLVGADWAKPVFDLGQMRRVGYPLPEGEITDATAAKVRSVLTERIKEAKSGLTPVFQAIPTFPKIVGNEEWITEFADEAQALADWSRRKAEVAAIEADDVRKQEALALRDSVLAQAANADGVWLEMIHFLRDATSDWQTVLDWIAAMPVHLQTRPDVEEQRILALAKLKTGDLQRRVGALKDLIARHGPSSERLGLLGGRYKDLHDQARAALPTAASPAERLHLEDLMSRHLEDAIEAYHEGMLCDLNDYYPACNLPGLLRIRGAPGDEELARTAAGITTIACQRAHKLGKKDRWLNPTLLLAAFQASDETLARFLARAVRRDGAARWELTSVLRDLDRTVDYMPEGEVKTRLRAIVEDLRSVR